MVVICTPSSDYSDNFVRDDSRMEKNIILLTPEFFTTISFDKAQFDDAPPAEILSQSKSLFLVPPTVEGLSLLSGSVGNKECTGCGTPSDDPIPVIPLPEETDQQKPPQFLPFKQSLAPYGHATHNSSYLSICQAQIPLGIFWDIENVRLPKNKSPASVIEAIRQNFLVHYREAEFLVVCDAFKEKKSLLMDLNGAQVTIVHVACTSKNAADDKLRQCMRRFIDNTGNPCAVMLISSDVNFAVDLSDFKNRKKIHVILLHGVLASEALLLSSNEQYLVDQLIEQVPSTPQNKVIVTNPVCLDVINLPLCVPELMIRQRLEQIAENCGGKVVELQKNRGVIRFSSSSAAERALLRMNDEDVFGKKISVLKSSHSDSACKKNSESPKRSSFPPPPHPAYVPPPILSAFPGRTNNFGFNCTPKRTPNSNDCRPFIRPSLSSQKNGKGLPKRLPEDEHHRREHNSSDEVSPQPSSSEYDEENERPEKQPDVFKTSDSSSSFSSGHVTKHSCDSLSKKRSRVNALISNIPHRSLPFSVFNELFNLTFKCSITLDDLKQMIDILLVSENSNGPILLFRKANVLKKKVKFINEYHASSALVTELPVVRPFCLIHDTEAKDDGNLLFVYSSLSELNLNIVTLLKSHKGTVPLASLPNCYASQLGTLVVDEERGVPLEQLIAFMSNVALASVGHYRIVQLKSDDHQEKDSKSSWNPLLATQLNMLSNEMVELLKAVPSHRIHFNQFNAAYYEHFGRHCKVSDFGYNELVDLFEAMHHVVQVLGEGTHRYLTLSHQIQINRFKSDVMHALKSQPNKQIAIDSFADDFEKSVGKPFDPREYGLCELNDLLKLLSQSKSIALIKVQGRHVIATLKKELSQEQLVNVKQFALEALKILKGAPMYRMELSKFIPTYHMTFGKQCKLSNYGCSKLAQLFDQVPEVLELADIENSTEKMVRLKLKHRLEILGEQLAELIRKTAGQLSVDNLPDIFRINYGFFLDPRDFECPSIWELLGKLQQYVQVVHADLGDELRLSNRLLAPFEKIRVLGILLTSSSAAMELDALLAEYKSVFSDECHLDFNNIDWAKGLFVVEGDGEKTVKLCSISELGRMLLVLITEKGGQIPFNELENQFFLRFGWHIAPKNYGHESLISVLAALSRIIATRGKGTKKVVFVNEFLVDSLKEISSKIEKTKKDGDAKELGDSSAVLNNDTAKPTCEIKQTQPRPVRRRIVAVFDYPS